MSKRRTAKVAVDVVMLIVLVALMAYQVTGEAAHGWMGAGMLVLVIAHHLLNAGWYRSLTKGRYAPLRILRTSIDLALLPIAALTLMSGLVMSQLLRVSSLVAWARTSHLCTTTWFAVLTGLHLGAHFTAGQGIRSMRPVWMCLLTGAAAYGAWQFVRLGMPSRLFLLTEFAFLDFDTPGALVLVQCAAQVWLWAWAGAWLATALRRPGRKGAMNA